MNDLTTNPLLLVAAIALLTAGMGFVNRWLTRKGLQEEAQSIRLEAENAEARRIEVAREEAARVQATIAQAAEEQKVAMDAQNLVVAQIHKDTNSAVQAWAKVETELRTKIEKIELAATSAASNAALALQTAKDLASRDLDAAKESIARLTTELAIAQEQIAALRLALAVANEQIAALTRQVATTPFPLPAPGVPVSQPDTLAGTEVVTVPAMVLPVEDATEKPLIIKPGDV